MNAKITSIIPVGQPTWVIVTNIEDDAEPDDKAIGEVHGFALVRQEGTEIISPIVDSGGGDLEPLSVVMGQQAWHGKFVTGKLPAKLAELPNLTNWLGGDVSPYKTEKHSS